MISDFAVFLTIVLMVLIDFVIGVPSQKLQVPSKFKVQRKELARTRTSGAFTSISTNLNDDWDNYSDDRKSVPRGHFIFLHVGKSVGQCISFSPLEWHSLVRTSSCFLVLRILPHCTMNRIFYTRITHLGQWGKLGVYCPDFRADCDVFLTGRPPIRALLQVSTPLGNPIGH